MAHSFKNLKIVRESAIETFFAKAYVCANSIPVPLRMRSLSNQDERDDDGVKYARRDWDENVAFGAKWNLSSEKAQGRRLKNFVQIRSVSSVDIAYSSQSWPDFYRHLHFYRFIVIIIIIIIIIINHEKL